jgi:hypothetical protein
VEQALSVSGHATVNQWRRHLSVGVETNMSNLPDSRPSVRLRSIGRVAAVTPREPAGQSTPEGIFLVARHDWTLPQLIRLTRRLHEDHAIPPPLPRLMRVLKTYWSLIGSLIPHRLRAIDYRSKLQLRGRPE